SFDGTPRAQQLEIGLTGNVGPACEIILRWLSDRRLSSTSLPVRPACPAGSGLEGFRPGRRRWWCCADRYRLAAASAPAHADQPCGRCCEVNRLVLPAAGSEPRSVWYRKQDRRRRARCALGLPLCCPTTTNH